MVSELRFRIAEEGLHRLQRSVKDHLNRTTTYWNDVLGRITQITDPLGNQTLVEYDVMDRVKKLTDPLKGLTQFT